MAIFLGIFIKEIIEEKNNEQRIKILTKAKI
jgi:hypothetical protein